MPTFRRGGGGGKDRPSRQSPHPRAPRRLLLHSTPNQGTRLAQLPAPICPVRRRLGGAATPTASQSAQTASLSAKLETQSPGEQAVGIGPDLFATRVAEDDGDHFAAIVCGARDEAMAGTLGVAGFHPV